MNLLLRYGAPVWVLLLVWPLHSSGQTVTPPPRVKKVEIKHVGPPAVSDELIKANIRVKQGDAYIRASVDDDVRNLYATGYFYNIRVADRIDPDGIVLTYILQGKPRLTAIKFEGNKKYSNSKLKKKLTSKEGAPLDERKLFVDSQEIQKMYQKAGYPKTEVKYVPSIDENAGTGTATFQIKESRKVKIKLVTFEGAQAFSQKTLRKQIKTRERWMFSWLTGSGVFKDEQFEDDRDKLKEFYQKKGYIDFEIKDVKFVMPTDRTMEIHFVIYEGNRYKVGAVTIRGNKLFGTNEITSGLKQQHRLSGKKTKVGEHGLEMDVGDIFTLDGLNKDIEAIEDFYGARGYIDVKQSSGMLKVIKIPNTETGTMDLEFQIEEGQKSYIEKIEIKGNTKTKDKVIRRELAVSPGEVFNTVRVKLSKTRLENLNYFSKVDMRDEPTDVPNRKNLTVGVEDKSTGNFTIGAGFSSVDNIVGFAEFTQGNFDLFKPPTFTGGGQKLRLRVQYGSERQDFLVSFIEPWLFNRKLQLSVDLYDRYLSFVSPDDLYDETRTGIRVGLTRALGSDFLIGGVSYTIETVGIINLAKPVAYTDTNGVVVATNEVPPSIQKEKGNALVSKFGASLAYDTRNNNTLPNKGQRTELLGELAGGPFGGEKDFYKLELNSAWFFKGFFEGHVFELTGRTGVAGGVNGAGSVPFYERYYLGGIGSLRGYKYRDVSPRDPGYKEPVGGDTFWFGSAEYSLPIIERLRFALFYDIGNVLSDSYDFDFSSYTDNWGVGLRLNLPIGPLRLDYGIPINHDKYNDGGGRFQFSVGYTRPL